jgi:hypothetical protein
MGSAATRCPRGPCSTPLLSATPRAACSRARVLLSSARRLTPRGHRQVEFSPFAESRLACAGAQHFGIIGNGKQCVRPACPTSPLEPRCRHCASPEPVIVSQVRARRGGGFGGRRGSVRHAGRSVRLRVERGEREPHVTHPHRHRHNPPSPCTSLHHPFYPPCRSRVILALRRQCGRFGGRECQAVGCSARGGPAYQKLSRARARSVQCGLEPGAEGSCLLTASPSPRPTVTVRQELFVTGAWDDKIKLWSLLDDMSRMTYQVCLPLLPSQPIPDPCSASGHASASKP